MAINITFNMDIDANSQIPNQRIRIYESQFESNPKLYSPRLRYEYNRRSLYTSLIIEYPDQPTIDISDIFEPLIQLCFYGVSTLIENKKAIYSLQVSYGSFKFEDKAGLIHYTAKNEPLVVLPPDEFLPALYHCGQRMLDVFWRFLDKKNISKEELMANHLELAVQAEQLLKQKGYLT